jgi:hypothetical protein
MKAACSPIWCTQTWSGPLGLRIGSTPPGIGAQTTASTRRSVIGRIAVSNRREGESVKAAAEPASARCAVLRARRSLPAQQTVCS